MENPIETEQIQKNDMVISSNFECFYEQKIIIGKLIVNLMRGTGHLGV